MQFPHANYAVPTARNEARVIVKPLDAPNFARVVFKGVLWRALSCVELVHRDGVLVCAGEQVAAV